MAFPCFVVVFVLFLYSTLTASSQAANSSSSSSSSSSVLRPLHASTWTATDALGRSLPSHAQVGDRRQHTTVGIFYFICQEHGRTGPWDNTLLLAAAGGDRSKVQYGPLYEAHHWGEPLYGYYTSDDPWVTAKHGSLLADAGVDFVFLDMTNAVTYDPAWRALLSTWQAMRRVGNPTPNFAIVLHTGVNATLAHMYTELYASGLYRDLWHTWDGKPLILGNSSEADPAYRDFFTWRQSWAWTAGQSWFGDGHDAWPWIDWYPQGSGWHDDRSRKEETPIAVAGWPTSNLGKSYDGYTHTQPPFNRSDPGIGHYFRQQFEWALNATCEDSSFICHGVPKDDTLLPDAVFITGWNEWTAGFGSAQPYSPPTFAASLHHELLLTLWSALLCLLQALRRRPGTADRLCRYSRDIEAMKGGHGDSFVYQLAAFVRWLKGAERPVSASQPPVMPQDLGLATDGSTAAAASSPSSWWSAVLPVFLDTVNDTQWRSHPGFGNTSLYYTDNSTVDDLCEAQAAVDQPAAASSLVFRVAACEAFNTQHSNSSTPPPLSLFFLGSSQAQEASQPSRRPTALTMGYQYRLNVTERQLYAADGSGGWRAVAYQVTVKWDARQLVVAMSLLPLFPDLSPASVSSLTVDHKWWSGADWSLQLTDAIDFMVSGDAAPNARFNYRFEINVTLAPRQQQQQQASQQ